jgi:hypothetical protein
MGRSHINEIPPTPEEGEGLHINSIVIPVDEDQPLVQDQLPTASLESRQRLVGGLIQGIDLTDPAARLYCNEEGKVLELPLNRRATLLLWAHNPDFRYRDVIVGDAFLVGPIGRRSTDTSVPDEYVERLFKAKQFRVEVKSSGNTEWRDQGMRFDQWDAAYFHGLGLGAGLDSQQRTDIADIRIIPE